MSNTVASTVPFPKPANDPIPLISLIPQYNNIKQEIDEAVQRVFTSQNFVLGDEVSQFEADMAAYCDSREAIGCASGSDALLLALKALDIGPGDEVITSPFSFFATASCIDRVGAKPVFVDIEERGFNLDPAAVEAAVTPRTKAIIPVHLFGQCARMDPICRTAVKHNLAIIEDAAQAIGAEYRGRRAGVLGTVGCFSFFPTKNLGGAGDGGLMTTDDAQLGNRLKKLRVHGDYGRYEHVETGINSRLDAIQAAVLAVKLRYLDSWTEGRQRNAAWYEELCEREKVTEAIELPVTLPDRRHVYNQFCIRVRDGLRDHVMQSLREEQIGCAVYYPKPLHLQPCFAHHGYKEGDFPISEQVASDILALPIFSELTLNQLERVVTGISNALKSASKSLPQSYKKAA
ncbi:DegT/DnrJ/EryC1/StrS family aminotransferase [bacterium]|uniref:Glutamine--scyllo-inositol transaminase n=1 Tax=Rubinisphaera brasiliensis (strain ATCC 49424 / DSM 5305 / JCM 21570 / IAM 15109 / NBRC 103401 / IFAM 1448) TaxID=756272 RepID=F0SMX6_RUBBR|nr:MULTISPECIES: DegT/DnrJ/EryC1/StrS family aminotransferase [Rubinisphaera]ADY59980.1 Glutamine--scyllo-inositol transaminase [Rubinisphaera brasiliensis DSM 5305]MBB03706.1 DegT/DnrJ/EryC1/StrS family aminotransferase [Planctomyces sp.]MBR9800472.1 DegT/DnrJ/EryC1/StrS family aminotransferase [bacterium]